MLVRGARYTLRWGAHSSRKSKGPGFGAQQAPREGEGETDGTLQIYVSFEPTLTTPGRIIGVRGGHESGWASLTPGRRSEACHSPLDQTPGPYHPPHSKPAPS